VEERIKGWKIFKEEICLSRTEKCKYFISASVVLRLSSTNNSHAKSTLNAFLILTNYRKISNS